MSKYLDEGGLTEVLVKMKGILATKASIAAIPTKISSLDNDSQYQTKTQVTAALPKNVSELTNDSEYQTKTQVQNLLPTKTSELENDSNYQTSTEVSSAINSAISENINNINSADSEVEGSYVSSVNQSNGIVTTTKTALPTVNDVAVSGKYVSAISQDKGKINIIRNNLPSKISELENDEQYITNSEFFEKISDWQVEHYNFEDTGEYYYSYINTRYDDYNNFSGIYVIKTAFAPKVKNIISTLQTDGTIPTSDSVASQIATALERITELEFTVVDALPATPTKGTIYLVPKGTYDTNSVTVNQTDSSGNTVTDVVQDSYDEYIWVSESTTDGVTTYNYEKIGSTDVDLSQYAKTTDIPKKVSELENDKGYLTNTSLSVPTKTSELTNDSGYITNASIPTKTSELTNDSGFVTSVPTKVSELTNDNNYQTATEVNTSIATAINKIDYSDSVTTGSYVSSVSQTNGKITVFKTSLPTVNDTAISGQYISTVSQSNGKINVTRSSLPSVTDTVEDNKYVSAVSQSNGKITVTKTALPTIEILSNDDIDAIFTEVFG